MLFADSRKKNAKKKQQIPSNLPLMFAKTKLFEELGGMMALIVPGDNIEAFGQAVNRAAL